MNQEGVEKIVWAVFGLRSKEWGVERTGRLWVYLKEKRRLLFKENGFEKFFWMVFLEYFSENNFDGKRAIILFSIISNES